MTLENLDIINTNYYKNFIESKNDYKKINIKTSQQEIDTFLFDQNMKNIELPDVDELESDINYIFHTFEFKEKTGLCTYLNRIGSKSFILSSRLDFGYITVGSVLFKSKNVFNVPAKNEFLRKIKHEYLENQKVRLGGNIHVWLTLQNGQILDVSINHTLNGNKNIIIGRPDTLLRDHHLEYLPYFVVDMHDLSILNDQYKDLTKRRSIKGSLMANDFNNLETY